METDTPLKSWIIMNLRQGKRTLSQLDSTSSTAFEECAFVFLDLTPLP
jgi:hypothetical protein